MRNYLFGHQQQDIRPGQPPTRQRLVAEEEMRMQGWRLVHALHQESLVYFASGLIHAHIVGEMFGYVFSTHQDNLRPQISTTNTDPMHHDE